MARARAFALLMLAMAVSGCVEPHAVTCANGTLCPAGSTCSPVTLTCVRPGSCGDGVVQAPEQCEPGQNPDVECSKAGFYYGTVKACTADCKYDTSTCSGKCGDGAVDGTQKEACDGTASITQSCADYGYDTGALTCLSCGIVTTGCRFFGWHREATATPNALNAVWVADADHAFAVGDNGTILSRANGVWTSQPSPTTANLRAVWGSSSNEVFAVGDPSAGAGASTSVTPTIVHLASGKWTRMDVPEEAGALALAGVWGSDDHDVFAVGNTPDGYVNHVLHFDGTTWSILATLDATNPSPGALTAITGVGSDVFVLEQYLGAPLSGIRSGDSVVHHYNGVSWVDSPPYQNVVAIWAATGTDLYAVTGMGALLRLDGNQSTILSTGPPSLEGTGVGYPMSALWGYHAPPQPDEIFAAGEDGATYRWNGDGSWEVMDTESTIPLRSIGGASPRDVYVTGVHGTILHYNGASLLEPFPLSGAMHAVWAASDAEAFAAGEGGVIEHYTGQGWSAMGSPVSTPLYGIWGAAPDDVFAVGAAGVQLHFDGTAWTSISGLEDAASVWRGVWGRRGTEVYAVGDHGLIQHWDGTSWSSETTGTTAALYAVGGEATSTFAAGAGGAFVERDPSTGTWGPFSFEGPAPAFTIRALDGKAYGFAVGDSTVEFFQRDLSTTWIAASFTGPVSQNSVGFISTSAVKDPQDVTASYFGAAGGELYVAVAGVHNDFLFPLRQAPASLNGLFASSVDHVFAATDIGPCLYDGVTYHWTCSSSRPSVATDAGAHGLATRGAATWVKAGRTWTPAFPAPGLVNALWARGDGTFAAVGDGGMTATFDGTSWTALPGVTHESLRAVHGTGAQLYAVGDRGVFLAGDGSSFSAISSGTGVSLEGVWAASSTSVFLVGERGTILHFDGSSVSRMKWHSGNEASPVDLHAVWGTSATDVYAAGDGGTLLHYDGKAWLPVSTHVFAPLRALSGTGASDVWAVGFGGTILRQDGNGWRPLKTSIADDLYGVAATATQVTFASEQLYSIFREDAELP